MCYGDSITAGSDEADPAHSYPGELQRLRPDFEVVNEGRDGDVSGNVARFEAALAEWPPDVVVLMLGTNDAVCTPTATEGCDEAATPEKAAANLLRMADAARKVGAKVLVLTPPPSVCKANCDSRNEIAYAMWMRDAFTGRLADVLRHTRTPRNVRIADLRSRLSDASWSTLSTNGLHPSTEGNRMIARFVAAYMPPRTKPRTVEARRDERRRGDTRPRDETRRHEPNRRSTRSATSDANPFARQPLDPRYAR